MTLQPLRAYQAVAFQKARLAVRAGRKRILLVGPCGMGKTRLAVEVAGSAIRKSRSGKCVVWMAHRDELLDQARERLAAEGVERIGMISPAYSRDPDAPVQVASVPTLVSMRKRGAAFPSASIVIVDEAHRAAAAEYRQIIEAFPGAIIIGLTSTPERADGLPMGDIFEEMIVITTIAELQALGVLVPVVTVRPEFQVKEMAYDPVVKYLERCSGEAAFCFCATVTHAETTAAAFVAAGVAAVTIHANTPRELRKARVEAFRSGDAAPLRAAGYDEPAPLVVCNVGTMTEGVDIPRASVVILARGVGSQGLFIQAGSRGMRAHPGKRRMMLLDARGSSNEMGLLEEDREFSLHGTAIARTRKTKRKDPSCPKCGCVFIKWPTLPDGRRRCNECGYTSEALPDPAKVVERPVSDVGNGASDKARAHELRRLARVAAEHPEWAKPIGWISHRYRARFEAWPPRGAAERAYQEALDMREAS